MPNTELLNRFKYHPATETTGPWHEQVRSRSYALAEFLDNTLPDGREKSLAMIKIEEAMFWANAAIARNS